jgi:hypothetical protein
MLLLRRYNCVENLTLSFVFDIFMTYFEIMIFFKETSKINI